MKEKHGTKERLRNVINELLAYKHENSYKVTFNNWLNQTEYIKAASADMAYIFFAYKRYSNGRGFFSHEVIITDLKTGNKYGVKQDCRVEEIV